MANVGLTWTKERIDLLTELWGEGLSGSQIAAELGEGVSRNAVISKAHRLGLSHGSSKVASTPHKRLTACRSHQHRPSPLPSKIQPRCPERRASSLPDSPK